jgi:hypothetical protein
VIRRRRPRQICWVLRSPHCTGRYGTSGRYDVVWRGRKAKFCKWLVLMMTICKIRPARFIFVWCDHRLPKPKQWLDFPKRRVEGMRGRGGMLGCWRCWPCRIQTVIIRRVNCVEVGIGWAQLNRFISGGRRRKRARNRTITRTSQIPSIGLAVWTRLIATHTVLRRSPSSGTIVSIVALWTVCTISGSLRFLLGLARRFACLIPLP